MDVFDTIRTRRSHPYLVEPAPSTAELNRMLTAASAAPDHGRQTPWRFIILAGENKDAFADVLEKAYRDRAHHSVTAARVARERARFDRAPLVVVTACIAADNDRIPRIERLAATAAATENLLLSATALGYGSMWRTGWPANDSIVKQALGLHRDDDIVAFVHLGTGPRDRSIPPRVPTPVEHVVWSWSQIR
jgi:nitroreductase